MLTAKLLIASAIFIGSIGFVVLWHAFLEAVSKPDDDPSELDSGVR